MQFVLFAAVALALYAGLYYCVGPKKAEVPLQPQNYSLGITLRHLLLGIALLFAVDGAVFHSRLYTGVLERNSYAGRVALVIAQERARTRLPSKQEIALLGDSRMYEAFSAKAADARAAKSDLRFVNLAMPQCEPRVWFYLLREVDPRANRYRAIVLPIRYDDLDHSRNSLDDATIDIALAAPLLHYGDALEFARTFSKWPDKCRAFISCLLRGYALRDDVHDLLGHPLDRIRSRGSDADLLASRYEYGGNTNSMAGVTIDAATNDVVVPEHLAGLRAQLRNSIKPHKDLGIFKRYRAKWLRRILDRYAESPTTIVFVRMPRAPLGIAAADREREGSISAFVQGDDSLALDAHLFDRLERPELFADMAHLNVSGREIFTQLLTDELLGRFEFSNKEETAETAPPP
jgi:hypothetical protein